MPSAPVHGYPAHGIVPTNGLVPVATQPGQTQFLQLGTYHADGSAVHVPVLEQHHQHREFADAMHPGPHWKNHSGRDFPSHGERAANSNKSHMEAQKGPYELVSWPATFRDIHHSSSYPIQSHHQRGLPVQGQIARQSSSLLKLALVHDSILQDCSEHKQKEYRALPIGMPCAKNSAIPMTIPATWAAHGNIAEIQSSLRSQLPIFPQNLSTVPVAQSEHFASAHAPVPIAPLAWTSPGHSALLPKMQQVVTAPFAPGLVPAPITETNPPSFIVPNLQPQTHSVRSLNRGNPIPVVIPTPEVPGRSADFPLTKIIKKRTQSIRPNHREAFIGPIAEPSNFVRETAPHGTISGIQSSPIPLPASRYLPFTGQDVLLKVRADATSRVADTCENVRRKKQIPVSDQQRMKVGGLPVSSDLHARDGILLTRLNSSIAHSGTANNQIQILESDDGWDAHCLCAGCRRDHLLPRSSGKQHRESSNRREHAPF
jgi:hypothetical protein